MSRAVREILDPRNPSSPVLWFGAVGAPLAWAVQFGLGYWLAETKCSPSGGGAATVAVATWLVPISLAAAAAACLAGVLALRMLRGTASYEVEDRPPEGRIRFMAIVGLTAFPLFLVMIVMTGTGVLIHDTCVQS